MTKCLYVQSLSAKFLKNSGTDKIGLHVRAPEFMDEAEFEPEVVLLIFPELDTRFNHQKVL